MTNVTILQNNKDAKHFCSLPGSPRRLANLRDVQHLARLQEVSSVWCIYTIRALYRSSYAIYAIYANMTYMLHIHSAITLTKKICQESLKLSSNSNCSSLALRLASEGTFWWFHPERLHHLYYSSSNLYWHTDFLYGIGQLWVNCKSVDQQSRHQITPNCARLAQIKSVLASKTDIKLKKKIKIFYYFTGF